MSHRTSRFPTAAFAAGLVLTVTAAPIGPAQAQCGPKVQVRAGDTLSSIAERCDVTEAKILDLNPKVEGSRDLRAGMELALTPPSGQDTIARAREAGESLLGRLKSYAREAGQAVEGAAEQVTGSVQDFLQRNPDLHQRVRKLGQRLSIPGMDKVEAQVSMSVRKGPPGTAVTLSAIGLPANQPVEIAGGAAGSEYQVLDQSRTSADGTLQVTVQVPESADPQRDFIFVVANTKIELAARSATFDVVAATSSASK
jgi:LysM repeat protein